MSAIKKLVIFILLETPVTFGFSKEDLSSDTCSPPEFAFNGTETDPEDKEIQQDYVHVKEVKFFGSIGPLGEQRLCKIKCIAGQWVGPLCITQQDNGRFQPLFRNCKLEYINPNLIVTFKSVVIKYSGLSFPHGAKLHTKCQELGLYKLLGIPTPQCQNGIWSSRLPSCIPTTLLTNFTEDSPPSIVIRTTSGSASFEPSGELAVYPGSTLHFECVFPRKLGSPDWTWTSPLGQYPTGWAIATDERNWKYRLSIYYTKSHDSGTFTCATPRGITNSITMQVVAKHCDPISVTGMHLSVRVEGTRLGHKAIFQCPVGFQITGEANLTCQVSGKWSAPVPKCELVKCPSLDMTQGSIESHLQLEEYNNSYGGRAVFSCEWGYRLQGPPGLECELNGNWSGTLPKCLPIQCPPPVLPVNGNLIQSEAPGNDGERFAVGSLVQFTCKGAHNLEGEATIVCTETGFWSHPPPFCKPRCPYIGEPENGLIAPTKFAYDPGDELDIICNSGFTTASEVKPKCLPDGQWSSSLPYCINITSPNSDYDL